MYCVSAQLVRSGVPPLREQIGAGSNRPIDQLATLSDLTAKLASDLPRRWSMANLDLNRTDPASVEPDTLEAMPQGEFVRGWKAIVGEPPAIMLDSRTDMVRVLVESVPIATPDLADTSAKDQWKTEEP